MGRHWRTRRCGSATARRSLPADEGMLVARSSTHERSPEQGFKMDEGESMRQAGLRYDLAVSLMDVWMEWMGSVPGCEHEGAADFV